MKSQIANRQSTRHSFPSWLRGFVAACLLATAVAQADPLGTAFTYQGHLENGSGPVTDTCDFAFALYEDASGTMQVGTTQPVAGVTVTGGVFTVGPPNLDFGEGAFNGQARWLKISVCCPATCAPVALSPLVELTAAPYALALPGVFPDTATGNVGIGTTTPVAELDVVGTIRATDSAGTGVIGSGSTAGVFGVTTSTSGTVPGVWGRSDSTNGRGVLGVALAAIQGLYEIVKDKD